jgi:hypothetical protein
MEIPSQIFVPSFFNAIAGEKIGSEKCWVNIAAIHKILNPKKVQLAATALQYKRYYRQYDEYYNQPFGNIH